MQQPNEPRAWAYADEEDVRLTDWMNHCATHWDPHWTRRQAAQAMLARAQAVQQQEATALARYGGETLADHPDG